MPFLTQGKTNWKFIGIVVVLATIAGGGILVWIENQEIPPAEPSETVIPDKAVAETEVIADEGVKEIVGNWSGDLKGVIPGDGWLLIEDLNNNEEKELVILGQKALHSYVIYVFGWQNNQADLLWSKEISTEDFPQGWRNKIAIGDTDYNGIKEVSFIHEIREKGVPTQLRMLSFEWDGVDFSLKREVILQGFSSLSGSSLVAIGDVNNDGKDEVVTLTSAEDTEKWGLCPAGYLLILSWDGEQFVPIYQGSERIDCTVGLQIGDTDNNGINEIIITNAYETWISAYTLFEWDGKDYIKKRAVDFPKLTGTHYYKYSWLWVGDFYGDEENVIIARKYHDLSYSILKWHEEERQYVKIETIKPAKGYFVLSSRKYAGGKLGGLSGANQLCYEELRDHPWMGKDLISITPENTSAWLCDMENCNNLQPGPYQMAVAGQPLVGGWEFIVDVLQHAPNDRKNWNDPTAFGGSYTYFVNRKYFDEKTAAFVPNLTTVNATCNGWTDLDGNYYSTALGSSGHSKEEYWGYWSRFVIPDHAWFSCQEDIARLICVVNP